jgi:hypothetical protein
VYIHWNTAFGHQREEEGPLRPAMDRQHELRTVEQEIESCGGQDEGASPDPIRQRAEQRRQRHYGRAGHYGAGQCRASRQLHRVDSATDEMDGEHDAGNAADNTQAEGLDHTAP